MPYGVGATKAMKNMQKEYGSNWKSVYFALANKRAGRGLRGAHRGHIAANTAYAKGRTWSSRSRSKGKGGTSKGASSRSRNIVIRTKGRANISHRSNGHSVRIRVN
jgi:hypothetical protein